MLRSTQKEIERDTNLSGDVFTMKAKLKSLQEQVDNSDKKISALRNEVRLGIIFPAGIKLFIGVKYCTHNSCKSAESISIKTATFTMTLYHNCSKTESDQTRTKRTKTRTKQPIIRHEMLRECTPSHYSQPCQVISRDKNLTNRQKEIVDLRLELRKHSSLALPKPEDQPSVLLSPGSRQRPIQVSSVFCFIVVCLSLFIDSYWLITSLPCVKCEPCYL